MRTTGKTTMICQHICLLLCALLCTTALHGQTDRQESATGNAYTDTVTRQQTWAERVADDLDALLQGSLFDRSQVGIMVYDLTAGSVIYTHNARQTMRPASTMKLLTAVTALDRLGSNYSFRTSLCRTGEISGGTLTGDLYCVGGFDPAFSDADMDAFVASLIRLGVDTVRGHIVADKSMKDNDTLGEGWCWDDDNPTLSPLLVNGKDVFTERFATKLKAAGITVDAPATDGITPDDADTLCTLTRSIDDILTRMMKVSDNLYAEALFYNIAAARGHKMVTAKDAAVCVRGMINKIGLRSGDYRIADGSGLSLYNYVSPSLEVAFLRYAYANDDIYTHLYPALPIAGRDGTLKKRMRGNYTEGNVHAKTGTVTAVCSLAGYCTSAAGDTLCFAIINQGVLHENDARAFQDKVCAILCTP